MTERFCPETLLIQIFADGTGVHEDAAEPTERLLFRSAAGDGQGAGVTDAFMKSTR
jgi:hypothetical protein